jgi:hypothetical protein
MAAQTLLFCMQAQAFLLCCMPAQVFKTQRSECYNRTFHVKWWAAELARKESHEWDDVLTANRATEGCSAMNFSSSFFSAASPRSTNGTHTMITGSVLLIITICALHSTFTKLSTAYH